MATIEELSAALVKADAAGDAAGAKTLADAIRAMQGSAATAAPAAPAADPNAGENTGQGPTAPPATSLIQFPNGSGNTPTAASVTDMQQPNNGAPAPAAAGDPSQQPPAQAPPSPESEAPSPGQPPSSGNWLIDAANVMAPALRGDFGPLLNNPNALGNTASFLNNLGSNASFGVAPAIQRTVMNAVSPGSGDQRQSEIDATNEANPAGAVAGAAAAIPVDAMLTAPLGGIGAEGSVAGNVLRGGGAVGNVARAAGFGAAGAGVDTLANGGSLGDAAMAAGVGAVAGPVIGKVLGAAAGGVKSLMTGSQRRAWGYIAEKLGVPAADLTKFVQSHEQLTGQTPSIQQVLDAHAAGAIKDFAESNPQTAMMLQAAKTDTEQALPATAKAVVENSGIVKPAPHLLSTVSANNQTPLVLKQHLDANFTAAMDPIRKQSVELPISLFSKRRAFSSLPQDVKDGVQKAMNAGSDMVQLPLDRADNLRQVWRGLAMGAGKDRQYFYDRGTTLSHELMNNNGKLGQHYGDLLSKYGEADRYRLGFNHAFGGGAAVDTATGKVAKAVATAEGASGHAAGTATFMRNQAAASPQGAAATLNDIASAGAPQRALGDANAAVAGRSGPAANAATDRAIEQSKAHLEALQAVRASTPDALRPQDEGGTARNLITGAGEMTAGLTLSGWGRWGRAATDFLRGAKFSPAAQRAIGTGLTSHDPKVIAATLAHLKNMQVDVASFKKLQAAASAVIGGDVGQVTMKGSL